MDKTCLICLEEDKLLYFVPCLHRVICNKCANDYIDKYNNDVYNKVISKCPVCKIKWTSISKEKPLIPPNETFSNVLLQSSSNNTLESEVIVFSLLFNDIFRNPLSSQFFYFSFY